MSSREQLIVLLSYLFVLCTATLALVSAAVVIMAGWLIWKKGPPRTRSNSPAGWWPWSSSTSATSPRRSITTESERLPETFIGHDRGPLTSTTVRSGPSEKKQSETSLTTTCED